MKKSTQSFLTLGALTLALGIAPLYAQQTPRTPPTSTPPAEQQQHPDQTQPPAGQNGADAQAQSSANDGQTFSGTVVKQGDRYGLQDASGKTYDLDKQDGLKQYEGKQVRVKGTLDPDGKTIHMK